MLRVAGAFVLSMSLLCGGTPQGLRRHSPRRIRLDIPRVHIAGGPWSAPTFADSTAGDRVDGDDPLVRYAAVAALGPFSGAVIVVDPRTGRILTMVNQKLAASGAFQPCSTIKIITTVACLSEDVIHGEMLVENDAHLHMTLTRALEHSSNRYFAAAGTELGFDRFLRYARMLGLGETAGLNIAGETPGILPAYPPPDEDGGMGMMTSFGLGMAVTPLELAALVSTIANGGTLYYLQYPHTPQEVAHFAPRVKRAVDIRASLPGLKAGMLAAVEVGTGRGANDGPEDPIFGKTGTCTDARFPTHLGWFASFNEGGRRGIAVVVLLTGGQPSSGKLAASIAGAIYKSLHQDNYH